jgi:Ca2+-binding RTX toxin-like protein
MKALRRLTIASLVALAFTAPAAEGARVSVFRGEVFFSGSPEELNDVSIVLSGGEYEVRDPGALLFEVDGGCVLDVAVVRCPAAGVTGILVLLFDGADQLAADVPVPVQANGGDGDDVIEGGPGNDDLAGGPGADLVAGGPGDDRIKEFDVSGNQLIGGPGRDRVEGGIGPDRIEGGPGDDPVLYGDAGDDVVDGGEGDDVLHAGLGPRSMMTDRDRLIGGPGVDLASFAARPTGVRVSIGDGPDDGFPGEGADVAGDIENVLGGDGFDTLVGGPGPNGLDGGGGGDTISGGDGDDVLAGGADGAADTLAGDAGDDRISGQQGGDQLRGGEGDDELDGGDGADGLEGGGGSDGLGGGAGDDTLDGGVGPDRIAGGDGTDTVRYPGRDGPVEITLDGRANDGEVTPTQDGRVRTAEGAGTEGDDVDGTTESATGGRDDDTLTGDRAANRLDGGSGEDVVTGGSGADALSGGGRSDAIVARDGAADRVTCGLGYDYVIADRRDEIARGARCEFVDDGSRSTPRARRDVVAAPDCARGRDADIRPPGTARSVPVGRRVLVPVGTRIDAFDCPVGLTVAVGGGRTAGGTLDGGARVTGGEVPDTAGEMRLTQRRDDRGRVRTRLRTTDCATGATASRRPVATGARFPRRRYRRRFGRIAFPVTVRTGQIEMETRLSRGAVSWEIDDRCGGGATVRVSSGRLVVIDLASDRRVVLEAGERFP